MLPYCIRYLVSNVLYLPKNSRAFSKAMSI